MALKGRYNEQYILRKLKEASEQIENDLIKIQAFVGEKFVKEARDGLNISGAFPKGDYHDRTANLRSSIGYFILKDGVVIQHNLEGNSEGIAAAKTALQQIHPRIGAIQLILVAGMDYASYVESKGYNVLTSQGELISVDLERLWKKYAQKLNIQERYKL
jgi:hypothetical protein